MTLRTLQEKQNVVLLVNLLLVALMHCVWLSENVKIQFNYRGWRQKQDSGVELVDHAMKKIRVKGEGNGQGCN